MFLFSFFKIFVTGWLFVKICSAMVFINNDSSLPGDGTMKFPFVSIDDVFETFLTSENQFSLLSSQNITKSFNFTQNTIINGNDLNAIQLFVLETLYIEKNLTLSNLTLSTNLSENGLQISTSFL